MRIAAITVLSVLAASIPTPLRSLALGAHGEHLPGSMVPATCPQVGCEATTTLGADVSRPVGFTVVEEWVETFQDPCEDPGTGCAGSCVYGLKVTFEDQNGLPTSAPARAREYDHNGNLVGYTSYEHKHVRKLEYSFQKACGHPTIPEQPSVQIDGPGWFIDYDVQCGPCPPAEI
jgi:hypothetical protein